AGFIDAVVFAGFVATDFVETGFAETGFAETGFADFTGPVVFVTLVVVFGPAVAGFGAELPWETVVFGPGDPCDVGFGPPPRSADTVAASTRNAIVHATIFRPMGPPASC